MNENMRPEDFTEETGAVGGAPVSYRAPSEATPPTGTAEEAAAAAAAAAAAEAAASDVVADSPLAAPQAFSYIPTRDNDAEPTPLDAAPEKPEPPPADGGGNWARPQPVRTDSNVRSWLFFFAGICLVIALWVPLRAIYQRSRYAPDMSGIRDADSFIALAYSGISAGKVQGPEEVARFQFAAHIQALREHGFVPIGLQDVEDFYRRGRLLPRKAVLVTMEQSKKNSYLETRDILRENRWKAVMFVRGDTIEAKDPSALRWPILRDMALSGTWDVAAESMNGFRQISAGPDGETGNFFSSPMWITREQRLETPEEFAARVHEEHRRTVEVFKTEMGTAPTAFAYPYGDYGQYDPRAVSTRVLNMAEVGTNYGLGFSLGPFMLNTKYSEPRALNRLLVQPSWSVEQFISIVESGRAVPPWKVEDPLQSSRWLTDWGLVQHPEDRSLRVRAIPEGYQVSSNSTPERATTGALTWMVGSDLFGDYTVRVKFRVEAGQFGIRLRSRSGGEEGIRLLFDTDGNCWVNQKVFGAAEFIQASSQNFQSAPGEERELVVSLLGRNLFAVLDGKMMLKEPLDLMGGAAPGLFGLEVWDPEPGAASTKIVSLEFPRTGNVLLEWPPDEKFSPTYLMKEINHDDYRWGIISPPWMDALRAIPLVLPKWDDQTIQTFARMRGIRVMPRITLRSAELAMQIPQDLPATEAAGLGVDGVHLDCRLVPHEEIPILIPWLQGVHKNIKEHHMKLALQFPHSLTRLASFVSIAALFPGAVIAVDDAERAATLEESLPEVMVVEDMEPPPPAADMHLNLYYQIAADALPMESLSPQAQQDAFRREGYLAYQEGLYDKAIELWQKWLAEDPQSTEALSLIGRSYAQKEDNETALDYYTRSLVLSPGQISMVIRRAELLEKLGREDEAREQLNLYARIFPENPDILIAQAQWLNRHKRRMEARSMLETLVREKPVNLAARVALLDMQDAPSERYATMRGVLELGRLPDSQVPFAHSLLGLEMLTFPESGVFFDFIRDQAFRASDRKQHTLYESFLPLTNRVTDDFNSGRLSDGWIASGGIRVLNQGRYELRAAVDQSETYLRLRRSELMRDGFLEVIMDESHGFFWIYARRCSRGMVRFGFDQQGNIHMQAWYKGELAANLTRPWIRPPGSLKMRIELRGDGARGFVNDLEIFDSPLEIPGEVAYGWWGLAPFAFDLGIARVRIIRMDCEPSPATMVLVPPSNPEEQVVNLRPYVGGISALMPAWIFQNPDGSLPETLPANSDVLRMFCAFHQIRLLPVIDLSYDGNVSPSNVVQLLRRHRLAGAAIKRRTVPPKEWLDQLQLELEKSPADVVVLQTEAALWNVPEADDELRGTLVARPGVDDSLFPAAGDKIGLWELPVGSVLIPPLKGSWKLPLHMPEEDSATVFTDSSTPGLFLLGTNGVVSLPHPP